MRKSKLNKMSTANGKYWSPVDSEKPLNKLDELFGSYSTANIDEYKSQLDQMNALDLQRHATEVGEIPRDNRGILIKNLLKKFQES